MEITGRWILKQISTELGGRTCGDLGHGSQFDAGLNLANLSIEEVFMFVNIVKGDNPANSGSMSPSVPALR